MFKPVKLLKVMSVILIILGIIGVLFTVLLYGMRSGMEEFGASSGIDMTALLNGLTPLYLVTSLVGCFSMIFAGIFGVSGKSLKMAMIFGGVYALIEIYNFIRTITTSGFTVYLIFSPLLAGLFWWGIYQSKE